MGCFFFFFFRLPPLEHKQKRSPAPAASAAHASNLRGGAEALHKCSGAAVITCRSQPPLETPHAPVQSMTLPVMPPERSWLGLSRTKRDHRKRLAYDAFKFAPEAAAAASPHMQRALDVTPTLRCSACLLRPRDAPAQDIGSRAQLIKKTVLRDAWLQKHPHRSSP